MQTAEMCCTPFRRRSRQSSVIPDQLITDQSTGPGRGARDGSVHAPDLHLRLFAMDRFAASGLIETVRDTPPHAAEPGRSAPRHVRAHGMRSAWRNPSSRPPRRALHAAAPPRCCRDAQSHSASDQPALLPRREHQDSEQSNPDMDRVKLNRHSNRHVSGNDRAARARCSVPLSRPLRAAMRSSTR